MSTENITAYHNETASPNGKYPKVQASNNSDYMGDLLVNKSQSFCIRFRRENLITAVTYNVLASVFELLIAQDMNAPSTQAILQRQRIIPATDATFTVTARGEQLLYDGGRRADDYLLRVLRGRDLETARRELGRVASQLLSQERLLDEARQIGEGLLDDLEDAGSIGSHIESLGYIVEELTHLLAAVSTKVSDCSSRRTTLQNRLNANNASTAAQQQPATPESGRLQWLRQKFDNLKHQFNSQATSATVVPPSRPSHVAEKELLKVELELRALNAELILLGEVVADLNREIMVDENTLSVLRDEQQKALTAAHEAEGTRDYGIAGGEMLLNDSSLTKATMDYMFGSSNAGCANQILLHKEQCRTIVASAQGVITSTVLAEMQQIIHDAICDRLKDFTIADAIASLHSFDENFQSKVRNAFKMTASLGFLETGYENYLDLQRFISVSYASSALPSSNTAIKAMLDDVFSVLNLEADTKFDRADTEGLRLQIAYFSIPLKAFRFYGESCGLFESVQNDARFCIHPDLYKTE